MSLITLLTDFGLKDGNVGVMKGVIWGIAPQAQIADLSHDIQPQNVREAAWVLARHAPYFPEGTIHIVVVDPGVGTARRPIAARVGRQLFVGPDNGVLTLFLERTEAAGEGARFVLLDKPAFWLAEVSPVFHGRDVFAPVGAHLASGVPLGEVGSPIDDPVRLELPQVERRDGELIGAVMHIDRFGNVATNVRREHLGQAGTVTVEIGRRKVRGLVPTFGERSPGELVALYGSTGDLILAEVNGSAARSLGARVGQPVRVIIRPSEG